MLEIVYFSSIVVFLVFMVYASGWIAESKKEINRLHLRTVDLMRELIEANVKADKYFAIAHKGLTKPVKDEKGVWRRGGKFAKAPDSGASQLADIIIREMS